MKKWLTVHQLIYSRIKSGQKNSTFIALIFFPNDHRMIWKKNSIIDKCIIKRVKLLFSSNNGCQIYIKYLIYVKIILRYRNEIEVEREKNCEMEWEFINIYVD